MKCLFGHDWYKENDVDYHLIETSKRDVFEAAIEEYPELFRWHDVRYPSWDAPEGSKPIYVLRFDKKCFNGICRRCNKIHLGFTDAQKEAERLMAVAVVSQEKKKSLNTKLSRTLNTHAEMKRRI